MNLEYGNDEMIDAKETLEIIYEISELLNCQLDRQTLAIIVSLVENGVHPVAIASVVKELKKEATMNNTQLN